MYLLERIALGERLIPCRRGLLFVGDASSCWHAVVYGTESDLLAGFRRNEVVSMAAVTPDGMWLEGLTRPQADDTGTGVHYLSGVGPLFVSFGGGELTPGQERAATKGRLA